MSATPFLEPPVSSGRLQQLRMSVPWRLRASGIHLAISAAIFAGAMALFLLRWYPGFHFVVDGGWQGTRIMVGVDLVLGPTLTLIIFNPFKARRLIVFDLCVIGLTQLGALAWAFYAIGTQHPVSVNYYDGKFYSMTSGPMNAEKYPLSLLDELSPGRYPALIYVAPPANDDERARVGMIALMEGLEEYQDPLRFKAFPPHWGEVKPKALDPVKLGKEDAKFAAELPEFVAGHGGKAEGVAFFPFEGRNGRCTLAFTQDGELLGAVGCHAY